jgi:hypothetical protein
MIARPIVDCKYGLVSSLDNSPAFNVVSIEWLLKRLKFVGLPKDIIQLISVWLIDRSFYVIVDS